MRLYPIIIPPGRLSVFTTFFVLLMFLESFSATREKVCQYPLTRAEETNFTETSRYQDVMTFISSLQNAGGRFALEYFGTTAEGKKLPLAIFSDPEIFTPVGAKRLGKPVVFVMANIHAGEVEGKEAAQIIMREIVDGRLAALLKHMVLLVAPIYNADGNDKISIYNRTDQNGPYGGVGARANSQGLDLNRDYIKLESPEAQGLVANVFDKWDPDVFIDLHTTDGSYHGYALTYSGPLNPNTDKEIMAFEKEKLFPSVSKVLLRKYNYRTYYYGDFVPPHDPYGYFDPDSEHSARAWATFNERPRFGTNYLGLRNRLCVLSEAYSHLDFKTRIDVTKEFVIEILDYVSKNPSKILSLTTRADEYAIRTGTTRGHERGFGTEFKFEPSDGPVTILEGSVRRVLDERTGKYRIEAVQGVRPLKMIEYEKFAPTKSLAPPAAYVIPSDREDIIKLLQHHGIIVYRTTEDTTLQVQQYLVDSLTHASISFQKHHESKLTVTEKATTIKLPAGTFIVSTHQPEAGLIFYLLEPESDDGLAVWNYFDADIETQLASNSAAIYPVYRLSNEPKVSKVSVQ